jgi:hypothetical protein
MAFSRVSEPIEPMTLGNMRANGVHSLAVSCHLCHHEATISAARWPDDVPVPTFGPRMVCTRGGIIGADARPNWGARAFLDYVRCTPNLRDKLCILLWKHL